jgi:C4-dicarboxylate transporter DctM subunit
LLRLVDAGDFALTAIAIFGALVLLMVLGVPIGIALAATAGIVMFWMGGVDLTIMLAQRMYAGTTSFPLLAIPLFILAGNLMNSGGTTLRIFDAAHLFVGRIRGGLAHVNVVSSMIFAGMSGSAVADAAGLALIEIEAMKKAGYAPRFAATVSAVSATIGPIIPPSIPFVIYGSLANVSIGTMFLAGVVPGVLMGIAMMIVIALIARRKNLPVMHDRPTGGAAVRLFLNAFPAIITPVIIVGGILLGVFTPTEAAAIASLYAFALGFFFYGELRLADLPEILWQTAQQTVQVLFIIAGASAFGWILIQQQVPNAVIEGILSLSTTPWVVLLLVNVILLVLGCFIEAIAIMIMTYPVFLPLMAKIGVSPEHFGVIMVLNLMIGLITPPVGLCLYAVSTVSKVPIRDLLEELWPYVIALLAVLGLITYIPEISMFLPRWFGLSAG